MPPDANPIFAVVSEVQGEVELLLCGSVAVNQ